MALIERQKRNRRSDSSPEFPLVDSEGVSVIQNRRRLSDRRRGKYDLGDLEDKVYHLKITVYTNPRQHALNKYDSLIISRVLHEISIGELLFLLGCHEPENCSDTSDMEAFNNVDMFSLDRERTIGLMNLGLLSHSDASGDGNEVGTYCFTPLAARLVKLFIKASN